MPDKPRVWNMRDPNHPVDAIYVGRPSRWGNPWRIGRDGTREEVVEMYRRALPDMVTTRDADGQIILDISKLRGKNLVCWCAPLPCHGDVLLEMANA